MTDQIMNEKISLDGGDYAQFDALNKPKKTQHIRDLIKDVALDAVFECELIELQSVCKDCHKQSAKLRKAAIQ